MVLEKIGAKDICYYSEGADNKKITFIYDDEMYAVNYISGKIWLNKDNYEFVNANCLYYSDELCSCNLYNGRLYFCVNALNFLNYFGYEVKLSENLQTAEILSINTD